MLENIPMAIKIAGGAFGAFGLIYVFNKFFRGDSGGGEKLKAHVEDAEAASAKTQAITQKEMQLVEDAKAAQAQSVVHQKRVEQIVEKAAREIEATKNETDLAKIQKQIDDDWGNI